MRTLVLTLMASAAAFASFGAAQAADAVDQIPEAPVVSESYAAPAKEWSGAYVGGTIYGGYNFQNGQIVYGPEADISYSNQKDGDAGTGIEGKEGFNGSLRARVGYDMSPFLIYGTGGLAIGNHELETATDSDSQTAIGYTVGGGVEALVTDNITARVEYRYTEYQSKDFDLGATTVSRGFDDHSVKVGIGVKF